MPTRLDIGTGDQTTTLKDHSLLNVSLMPRAKVSGEWSKSEEVWAERKQGPDSRPWGLLGGWT